MTFSNIQQYSKAFLDSLSGQQLMPLIHNCFTSKTKNYELLAKLTHKLEDTGYDYCPMQYAIKILEDKAIEVMLNNYSNKTIQNLKNNNYYEYSHLSYVFKQIKAPIPYGMSIKTKKEKILNMADKFLALKDNVTKEAIEDYALVAPLPKVFKLLIDKKVNLQKMDLSFPQFDVEYQKPLLVTNRFDSIEDILLTHTYADNKNITEIKATYTNLLYNNSKMAADALKYTALNILKGDDIKIFFGPKFEVSEGGYMPFHNYVIVNPTSEKLTEASIFAHEIEHYILCNLNPDAGCFPFDNSKIKLLSSTQDNQYGFFLNKTNINNSSKITYFNDLNEGNNIYFQYELAAKPVFIKIGELLGLNKNALDPYIFSKDSILYLKDNTLIDLFLKSDKQSFSQTKAYAEAYYQYSKEFPGFSLPNFTYAVNNEAVCFTKPLYQDIESLGFDDQQNLGNQINFVRDYYLPYFIKKMNLGDKQEWFLHRMAEMFNREEDIYKMPTSTCYEQGEKSDFDQYYIELIVRYPEFIASGMDQDILDSFDDLAKYYEMTASPLVQEQINEFFTQYKAIDYALFV